MSIKSTRQANVNTTQIHNFKKSLSLVTGFGRGIMHFVHTHNFTKNYYFLPRDIDNNNCQLQLSVFQKILRTY